MTFSTRSKKHTVVLTTHSPLFLGPNATATFIRLSKSSNDKRVKPYTEACHFDRADIALRDEFHIICFENNNAAFFAKRVVLVEGDSDFIVFPHIAQVLNEDWSCMYRSVAFVRVGGKGSIAKYRDFFARFNIPVYVIADLDCLYDGFDKLGPSENAKLLKNRLMDKVDASLSRIETTPLPKKKDIENAQSKMGIRDLWDKVRTVKVAYDAKEIEFAELDTAIKNFFAWEKKNIRRDCIQNAEQQDIKSAKLDLIWEFRNSNVFILERGALEDYYPENLVSGDKTSKAQNFCLEHDTKDKILPLSPEQVCPITSVNRREFEFIFSRIFD